MHDPWHCLEYALFLGTVNTTVNTGSVGGSKRKRGLSGLSNAEPAGSGCGGVLFLRTAEETEQFHFKQQQHGAGTNRVDER